MRLFHYHLRASLALFGATVLLLASACSNDGASSEASLPKTSIGSIYESEAYKQALQAADSVQDKPLPAASAGLLSGRDVRLSPVLDEAMVAKGQRLYASNCQACHSLGTDKTVGPGWQGITVRRQPEWILNMILHTDAMLTHDATARKLLAEYQVRMPTQTISQDEARQVLEFMRTLK